MPAAAHLVHAPDRLGQVAVVFVPVVPGGQRVVRQQARPPALAVLPGPLQQLQVELGQLQQDAALARAAAVRPGAVRRVDAPLQLAAQVHLAAAAVGDCGGERRGGRGDGSRPALAASSPARLPAGRA